MSFLQVASRPSRSQGVLQAALLTSVSAFGLLIAVAPAVHARAVISSGSATATSSAAALAAAQQAAASAQRAQQSIARAAGAVRAMQAAQDAARNIAAAGANNLGRDPNHPGQLLPDVPNGLIDGGLAPDSGLAGSGTANAVSTWVNANTPRQASTNGQTTVTIQQTAAKAILNWKTFNVGKNTTVYFNQSAGADADGNGWIALNRVADPTDVPSQILGQIRAEGAVYLINQSGIIFGGTSQVNVGTLLASTLSITNDQFNFGILYQSSGNANIIAPAFVGTPGLTKALTVQAGAIINAMSSGKVLLLGGNVTNAGTISTPQGQTILASGDSVYLEPNTAAESNAVRGIVANVENGVGVSYVATPLPSKFVRGAAGSGWTALNDGLINSNEGNIELVGQNVTQNGVLSAATSATLDGSIKLWARTDQYVNSTTSGGVTTVNAAYRGMFGGNLTIGPGSLTQVRADLESSDFLLDPTTFKAGAIDLVGKTIVIQANATMLGEAAKVTFRAADMVVATPLISSGSSYLNRPDDGSRIYFDTGSLIDVSGLQNVPLAMERNSVKVELRGDEFSDYPQLRNGALRGATVYVDRRITGVRSDGSTWTGTAYGDVVGWLGLVPYYAGELMSSGGSVTIDARGEVITRAASQITAAGGSIKYASGYVKTSMILWNGRKYDIGQATADMVGAVLFDGSFRVDHAHWNQTEIYRSPLFQDRFEQGYTQGQNGGQVQITAHHAVLDGGIDVSAGIGDFNHIGAAVAAGGKLTLGQILTDYYDRTLPQVVVGTPKSLLGSGFTKDTALTGDLSTTVYIRPNLINDSGAKDVAINTNQTFTLDSDASITLAPGGSFNVLAGAAIINGDIRAPAGDITVVARVGNVQTGVSLTADKTLPHTITVGPSAIIDATGLWINLFEDATQAYSKAWLNGGNVTLSAERAWDTGTSARAGVDGSLNVSAGSLIDVSSGGLMQANGRLATTSAGTPLGNAGTISLIGSALEKLQNGVGFQILPEIVGSTTIAGELRGYGLGGGGSLAIAAATVQIGGATSLTKSDLYLDPSFFQSGGFSNYKIIGWNGVMVAPGTVIEPKARSFLTHTSLLRLPTGSRLIESVPIGFKIDSLRAPTSLTLYAPNYGISNLTTSTATPAASDIYKTTDWGVAGDIILGAGSVIRTDPGASVEIRAARELAVYGTIEARGGSITLANDQESGVAVATVGPDNASSAIYHRPTVTLWIDASAQLLAPGLVQTLVDPNNGKLSSRAFDGGSVTLTGGNIVVQPGSTIDVSGGIGSFVPSTAPARGAIAVQQLATGAGSITLTPGNYLYFDPTLSVQPGDSSVRGATFTINPNTSVSTNLVLAFNQTALPYSGGSGPTQPETSGSKILLRDGTGQISPLTAVGVAMPTSSTGRPQFTLFEDSLQQAGFDNLIFSTRDGVVAFRSNTPVNLTARRSIQFLSRYIGGDGSVTVNVNAPYVAFGGATSDTTTNGDPADSGTGSFTVNADLIDFSRTTTFGVNRNYRGALGVTSALSKTAAQAGFATINFNSTGDIRFNDIAPTGISVAAALNTYGEVTFTAAELYPLTRTGAGFVINGYALDTSGSTPTIKNPNSTITIKSNGNIAAVPLSANGSLTISAPHIVQAGTLRAPSGQLTLTNATVTMTTATANIPAKAGEDKTIILTAGSLTSVDLEGALVPYGVTRNGTDFLVNGTVTTVAAQKVIALTGTTIDLQAGALVTASGGGDLATYEFAAGTGGTTDVLTGKNVFAVIPSYRGALPKDNDWGSVTSLTVGSSVYLSGIPGLAAGYYTLLPGHYALLPGAFRVTVNSVDSDRGPEANFHTAMGGYLTAGYLRDQFTGARTSQRWSTFLVESGDVVRSRSQYNESPLSDFLTSVASRTNVIPARLPDEPGRIQFSATSLLTFEGIARTAPIPNGRGGQIDISSGNDILITGTSSTNVANTLVLRADQLSNLQTESLLIGGIRQQTSQDGSATTLKGVSVTVNALNVTVDTQGTELDGTEIIFAAQNSVVVKTGSIIRATGAYTSTASPDLFLDMGTGTTATATDKANDGAAILALSNGAKTNFHRGNAKFALPALGNVTIETGAVLDGGNSMLIDGAVVKLSFGSASKIAAKSVQIGSNHVSIGDFANPQSVLPGLALNLAALAALQQIDDLTLRSRETIDLYGAFTFSGRTQLTLDAAGLIGTSNTGADQKVSAGTVNLVNTTGTAGSLPAVGAGKFEIDADTINLGGNVFIDGMTQTQLLATGSVTSTSSGLFDVRHGSLILQGARVTAAPLVSRVIQVTNGALTLNPGAGGGAAVVNAGGARLQFIAQSIAQNGNIELPGGIVVLQATAGDVTFNASSVTNASGFSKDFFDETRVAPAGRVDVIATGNVNVNAGALINVGSDGDAGTVAVTAGGRFDLRGTLAGQGGSGYRNAAFSLDAGTVADFDGINRILNDAHFDRQRDFRVRSGDVAIGAGTTIVAHGFTLSTDNGGITVSGRVNATGAAPGSIRLSASGNVVLASGAWLDAHGVLNDDAGQGGAVSLETSTGYVDAQAGSRIDLGVLVGGDNGVLTLRLPRTADGIDARNHLNGIVTGAGTVNVEAFKVYTGITTLAATGSGAGTLTFATIDADNTAFVNTFGTSITTRLKGELGGVGSKLHLLPGVEVQSSASLTVTNSSAVNLANYRYNTEAGVLTLRAAGDLVINGNISDGFTTAVAATGQLLSAAAANARSWSYRLIAGADITAGDVRQAHQLGDFTLAAATLVRTGTGNIELYAGRDIKFAARDSVLYTAGVGRDVSGLTTPANVMYGINGGNVTLVAGGNISDGNPISAGAGGTIATAPSDELITAWLYRQGNLDAAGVPIAGRPTSWWVDYTQFQQGGVGALGGGNIKIRAGDARSETSGKINNLSVALPTTGLVNNGQLLFTAGGGDLSIEASGNINSGLFYVAKGIGDIRTNRSFGTARTVSDTNSLSSLSAANKALPIYPVLALGDAVMNLIAGGDVAIEAIFNPTVTMQATGNATGLTGSPFAGFFTYSDRSAVSLTAVGGKAVVYGDAAGLVLTVLATSAQATKAAANARYTGDKIPDTDSATIQTNSLWPYQILPPTLKLTAFNGDVGFDGALTLYPSSTGTLEFLSAGSIRVMTPSVNATTGAAVLTATSGIAISDADPSRLPTPIAADFNLVTARARLLDDPSTDYATETDVNRERLHATNLLHKDDFEPALFYAANGDINFRTSTSLTSASAIPIISAKSMRLWASRDILDLRLLAQNVNLTDLTLVRAGRDFKLTTQTVGSNSNGNANAINLIYVAGPGIVEFDAGRNIDLGNSYVGIQSIGNLRNPALPKDGAAILLGAGMTNVDFSKFIDAYLNPASGGYGAATAIRSLQPSAFDSSLTDYIRLNVSKAYGEMVIAFIQQLHPGAPAPMLDAAQAEFQSLPASQQAQLSTLAWAKFASLSKAEQAPVVAAAWTTFSLLPKIEQEALVRPVFYAELTASAAYAANTDPRNMANYVRGFSAINTLFPTSDRARAGDIRMASSRVATVAGGDIELLAPAGSVILGVNQPTSYIVQGGGLLTQKAGTIYSMSYGDLLVGQAAVHTLGGGEIDLWSTTGNIDAGKGAKTRKNVVKPAYRTNMNGRTLFNAGSISTGAGIATLRALAGAKPGNVSLATPQGYVDAGDAGIRISGDLVIAAQAVLNANNIQVQGSAVGIPTIAVPNIGALTAASSAAGSATKAIEQPATNRGRQDTASIIIVEVVGYGGGAQDDNDSGHQPRRENNDAPFSDQRSQNPHSAVQVVGAGQLSPRELQFLTEEERLKLQ